MTGLGSAVFTSKQTYQGKSAMRAASLLRAVLTPTNIGPVRHPGFFGRALSALTHSLGALVAFRPGYGMFFHRPGFNMVWRISHFIQVRIGLAFVVIPFWPPESPQWML